MAICIIGKRVSFSREYGNYGFLGYDVDALVSRVDELLNAARPELIWYPDTGEMGIEHTNLRTARAENPVDEIAELMSALWQQAAAEQAADGSEAAK